MQLDKLIVETRVRSGWSSIDLGFSLARHFWGRSVVLYSALSIPIFCLTLLFDSGVNPLLPYFIFWWLKPLFERPILHMMSRELFSQSMSVKQVYKDFFIWFKPSFFWILTIRRLSVYRGMSAPIMLLERPKSSEYSKRANTLVSKFSGPASWLNIVLYHLETFVFFASFALIALFFPDFAEALGSDLFLDTKRNFYIDALYLFSMIVIAPFFTASGFMLYISRRIELEGWDIEIVFRNWMSNYREPINRDQINNISANDKSMPEVES